MPDSFDSVLAANPKHTVPLCVLHEQWQRLEPLLRLAGFDQAASASFAERLRAAHGPDADPAVSLDSPSSDLGKASSDLLKRLGKKSTGSRYRLEGEVARGGMGAILRVWDEDIRRHLAMKVVLGKGEAATDGGTPEIEPEQLARFLEEAQVTGQLDHPGIVPVHELGLDKEGRVFFTMKLVKGRDLKSIYDLVFAGKEGWSETRALTVLLKVCEAVAYAHKKGVIHRDLKPANVMVGDFGEVYVMDWGLARVMGRADAHNMRIAPEAASSKSVRTERREEREGKPDSPIVTMDGLVVGTPAYMSPEQALGEVEKFGPRSDVYAIGAMLYHLLARQVPYVPQGSRMAQWMVLKHVQAGPPQALTLIRKDTAPELVAICEKAMARADQDRYADTLLLRDDLRAFLERRVVKAYETGAWAEARKWVQRNKPLVGTLVVGATLALVGIGIGAGMVLSRDARAAAAEAKTAAAEAQIESKLLRESANAARAMLAAAQKANDLLSLSAISTLRDLKIQADTLWPAHPRHIRAYESWVAQAQRLLDGQPADLPNGIMAEPGLADHEKLLAYVRARARKRSPTDIDADRHASAYFPLLEFARDTLAHTIQAGAGAGQTVELFEKQVGVLARRVDALQRKVDEARVYEFDDYGDVYLHAQLSTLVSELKDLTDESLGGLYTNGSSARFGWGILRRINAARTLADRSIIGEDARRLWSRAIPAIAASPMYLGLRVAPQLGFLPLGVDPDTGFWEFVHIESGPTPSRGPDGQLAPTGESGLVFFLSPAGAHSSSGVDTLDACLVLKYPMTPAQLRRWVGDVPDELKSATAAQSDFSAFPECETVLFRLGLSLRSDSQQATQSPPAWTLMSCTGIQTLDECIVCGGVISAPECTRCAGDGSLSCPSCGGVGVISGTCPMLYCDNGIRRDFPYANKTCPTCKGTDKYLVKCAACAGAGQIDCSRCMAGAIANHCPICLR
ncbi:MAG: protein kinase [Planctomycetota bacterium]|nr:protein kinase [Planctomycetota bacterium]